MSELKPLKLELIVENVGIVLSTLEAIAEIPRFEDVKSKPVVDDFFGPDWVYHEIQYNLLWEKLDGPLNRLRISLNAGDVELIDCRQPVREILYELWKWVCRFQPKLEYRLGGLNIDDFGFGICDECSAAEPEILEHTRRLSNRLRKAGTEAGFIATDDATLGHTEAALGNVRPIPTRDQAFISYSHKDKKHQADLMTHLKPFVRSGSITV
ncbi:MAG: hypothetical protein HYV60_00810 [Planctomycetia bacterium]|nr:hypothetical protein [Planctomycetia bacterium]